MDVVKLIQLVLFILTVDIVLLAFGLWTRYMGRKLKSIGNSILEDGIVPAKSGLFGKNPETDIEAPRIMGYAQLYASFIAYTFSWSAFIAIPIVTIGFPLAVFLALR